MTLPRAAGPGATTVSSALAHRTTAAPAGHHRPSRPHSTALAPRNGSTAVIGAFHPGPAPHPSKIAVAAKVSRRDPKPPHSPPPDHRGTPEHPHPPPAGHAATPRQLSARGSTDLTTPPELRPPAAPETRPGRSGGSAAPPKGPPTRPRRTASRPRRTAGFSSRCLDRCGSRSGAPDRRDLGLRATTKVTIPEKAVESPRPRWPAPAALAERSDPALPPED